MIKLVTIIKKLNTFTSILMILFIIRIIPIVVYSILKLMQVNLVKDDTVHPEARISIIIMMFVSVLAETFIFQFLLVGLPLKIKYLKNKRFIVCLLSATIFGLIHNDSLTYIISGVFVGLVFNIFFVALWEKYNQRKAFFIIYWAHMIHNLISLTLIQIV